MASLNDLTEPLSAPMPESIQANINTDQPLYTQDQVQAAVEAAIAALPQQSSE